MLASDVAAIRATLSEHPGFRIEAVKDDTLDTLVVKIYDPHKRQSYTFWSWSYFDSWMWDKRHSRYAAPLRSPAQPMHHDPAEYDLGTPDDR